jgi:hypothetical protein
MRALSTALTAAVEAALQQPSVRVVIADAVDRPAPEPIVTGTTTGRSAIVQLADGSWVRAYVNQPALGEAAAVYSQRVTTATAASQWMSYDLRTSAAAGQAGVALSLNGAIIRLFYQRLADNALCYQESSDGMSWSAEVVAAAPGRRCWALASGGTNDLFAALNHVAGDDALQEVVFFAQRDGTWSAGQSWTNAAVQIRGLSCVYQDGTYYLAAGAETRVAGGLATATLTFDGTSWSALSAIHPLDDPTLGLSSPYPHLSYWAGLFRLATTLYDSGAVTGTATQRCGLLLSRDCTHWKLLHYLGDAFVNGALWAPGPLGDDGPNGWLVLDGALVRPSALAVGLALPAVDVSADVLHLEVREAMSAASSGTLTLDNRAGQYASSAALRANAQVTMWLGYGSEAVLTHRLYIDGISFGVGAKSADVVLALSNGAKRLERQCEVERTYTSQTLGSLLAAVVVGAGLEVGPLPATAQFGQTVDTFALPIGETWLSALQRLAGLYGFDWFVDESDTVQVREPQPSDMPVWSYRAEGLTYELEIKERANHIRVVGVAPVKAVVPAFAEAWDYADIQRVGEERYLHVVDRLLTTSAHCQLRADLELRYAQRAGLGGRLQVPLNPALQVLDVVTVSDAGLPADGATVRIEALTWTVDMETSAFDLEVDVGGV